ncbi:MAG: right-handed parallel beta-helix repeat-containing protein [Elusimicrobia bacterium]|nr:right-handed parallel beta-helix repeat-containing protein [Elusimicrobiota bacterium]
MSAAEEVHVSEDVWMQMLAILALVSGIFTAADYWPRLRGGAGPAPVAPPVTQPGPVAPTAPPVRGGMLVVDAKGGEGVFATLAAAIEAAGDGDTVVIRPGVYNEAVTISRSVVLSGAGTKPGDVTLTSEALRTVAAGRGRVYLKLMTVANRSTAESAAAIEVSGGSLVIEQFAVAAARDGIRVRDGQIDASDGTLEAGRGAVLEGRSRASLLRVNVSGGTTGAAIEGMGELRVESSDLRAGGSAIEAGQFSKVRLSEVSITNCGGAGVAARSGAEVRISRSRLTDNKGCGVSVDGAGLILEHVRFERDRCGVGFLGAGSLESVNSEYSRLELGPLAIKPGRERDVVVKGSGNIGLDIPAAPR